MKRQKDVLSHELKRMIKQGSAAQQVWSLENAWLPPLKSNGEVVSKAWEDQFLHQRLELQDCRLGVHCQGNTLCGILGLPVPGVILPVFFTPKGRDFGSLCLVCLRLAVTKTRLKGEASEPYQGFSEFHASDYVKGFTP